MNKTMRGFLIATFFLVNTSIVFADRNEVELSSISYILSKAARSNYHWQCDVPKQTTLTSSGSVKWLQVICRGIYPRFILARSNNKTGDLKINLVDANLADPKIYMVPTLAKTKNKQYPYTENMIDMGKSNPKFLAGINGGYFFEDRPGHMDSNCFYKKGFQSSTAGVGDGLLVINHQVYSMNCASQYLAGKGRSSIVEYADGAWEIKKINANSVPNDIVNGLGAGPGLIESIAGYPAIIMRWEGVSSTFEFSANTAVALAKDAKQQPHVIFFTVDGLDKKAGMYSTEMANFIYYVVPKLLNLRLVSAMSMDQGGSTNMYIRDANPPIVSKSLREGNRSVYDALFIVEK